MIPLRVCMILTTMFNIWTYLTLINQISTTFSLILTLHFPTSSTTIPLILTLRFPTSTTPNIWTFWNKSIRLQCLIFGHIWNQSIRLPWLSHWYWHYASQYLDIFETNQSSLSQCLPDKTLTHPSLVNQTANSSNRFILTKTTLTNTMW